LTHLLLRCQVDDHANDWGDGTRSVKSHFLCASNVVLH
jgi:hypothetical protein